MENELFEIRLNDTGKRLLTGINSWVKFFYICTILTCIFDLVNAYYEYSIYSKYSHSLMGIENFQNLVSIVFLVIYGVLVPIQAYFFYCFSARAKKAVHYGNSEHFSESFRWLKKHAAVAALLFALNSIWGMAIMYIEIKIAALLP